MDEGNSGLSRTQRTGMAGPLGLLALIRSRVQSQSSMADVLPSIVNNINEEGFLQGIRTYGLDNILALEKPKSIDHLPTSKQVAYDRMMYFETENEHRETDTHSREFCIRLEIKEGRYRELLLVRDFPEASDFFLRVQERNRPPLLESEVDSCLAIAKEDSHLPPAERRAITYTQVSHNTLRIVPADFAEHELTQFLFGDISRAYGKFLQRTGVHAIAMGSTQQLPMGSYALFWHRKRDYRDSSVQNVGGDFRPRFLMHYSVRDEVKHLVEETTTSRKSGLGTLQNRLEHLRSELEETHQLLQRYTDEGREEYKTLSNAWEAYEQRIRDYLGV